MKIPNVQNVVDEANKIMKMQIAPYINEEIEKKLRAIIKPECFKDYKQPPENIAGEPSKEAK